MFRLITDMAFSAMTSNGDIKLTFHIYKLSFLNFLIGMTIRALAAALFP
jgi:hypothetical protein